MLMTIGDKKYDGIDHDAHDPVPEFEDDDDGRRAVLHARAAKADPQVNHWHNRAAQIHDARTALLELGAVLEERVGDVEAPNLSRFQKAIDDGESVLQQVAGNRIAKKVESNATVSTASNGVGVAGATSVPGQIGTRSDAFDLLETVAKWFETHEPQSILPSEIRKAIRRGKMSPQELYMDLITDSEVRRQLYKDIGMPIPENQ